MATGNVPNIASCRYPLFGLLCLCFAGAILGDSAAESLLLANFDASVVPRMYLVNAVFLFLSSTFIIPLIDRVDRGKFFIGFALVHGCILLTVWAAIALGLGFLFIPLFSYSYVTKIFLFLMFWTLANDLIDSRQAGTQFPFIAAGGTLGAIGISFSIPWVLRVLDARNLVVVWGLLSIALAVGFMPLRKRFGRQFKASSDKQKHAARNFGTVMGDLGVVFREPLLKNMAILYYILFFVLLNQHYTFYQVIRQRFGQAEVIASFLGYFNGISMGATFVLQLTVAGLVIRKLGSTRSMFFLPAVLCLVFGILSYMALFSPRSAAGIGGLLWVVVAGVGLRIAFFDSFFSPNFQIFFSSLPQGLRGRGKVSIEGLVKPLAMTSASLWLMIVASRLPLSTNFVILLVMAVLMLIQTFRIRATYTRSLTQYLGGIEARASALLGQGTGEMGSHEFLSEMARKLETEPDEIRHYIIEVLARINSDESIGILRTYLTRTDGRGRAVVVSAIGPLKREDMKAALCGLLTDQDDRVVANSIEALSAFGDPEIAEGLTAFINHRNNRVRINAVVGLYRAKSLVMKSMLLERVIEMLYGGDASGSASALYALGEMGDWPQALHELRMFYRARPALVEGNRMVWRQYAMALGRNPVDWALESLLTLSRRFGSKQRNDLASAFDLALTRGCTVDRLVDCMRTCDYMSREVILRGLLVQHRPVDPLNERALLEIAREEADGVGSARSDRRALLEGKPTPLVELLSRAVGEECIERRINNLVYLSALLDRTGQIKKVARRLRHENKHVRARAIEVLDNVGNSRLNRSIIDLLDTDGHDLAETGGVAAADVIRGLAASPNEWVRMCAEHAGAPV